MESEVVKNVLLEELGVTTTSRSVEDVIRVYEKRYGNSVTNWPKLRQDVKIVLASDHAGKNLLCRDIIRQVLKNGLNYIYISDEKTCKEFRKAMLNAKRKKFMQRVYQVFN